MSYYIPIEIKTFSKSKGTFKDFIKTFEAKNNTMIFISEACYSWLKNNLTLFEDKNSKIFKQSDQINTTYIETINIDSSNCSFLKSIFCSDYNYQYLNGIPTKIFLVILDGEKEELYTNISASVISPENYAESPVNCIIDSPSIFDNSIIFLNHDSYQRLKRNTNTISNLYNLERLTWLSDERYPGGDILLHCLNYNKLYMLCLMSFSFCTKDFSFNQVPKSIYFIA